MSFGFVKIGLLGLAFHLPQQELKGYEVIDPICEFYAVTGSVTIELMLPKTFQDVADIMAGKDKAFLTEMNAKMIASLSSGAIKQLNSQDPRDSQALGMLSGQKSFMLLLQGHAESADDVEKILLQECKTEGADVLIDRGKQVMGLIQ